MNQIPVLDKLQPGIKNGITANGLEKVDNVVPTGTITIVKHFNLHVSFQMRKTIYVAAASCNVYQLEQASGNAKTI